MVDVEKIRSEYDLRAVAAQDIDLRKESVRELSGPCPKCGGDDRFHVNQERFICRSCHPQWGDVVEYIAWIYGLDFLGAVEFLTEGRYPQSSLSEEALFRASDTIEWQEQAGLFVQRTIALIEEYEAATAAAYLLERGIFPRTWRAFQLGYAPRVYIPNTEEVAPAVSIPWFRSNRLTGIRFRFLEPQHGYTKTAYARSNFSGALYGGQALKGRSDLVLCEGELNAISIWQETDDFDVLSIGSETTAITENLQSHLARWNTIYVWADKMGEAERLASSFPNAHLIESDRDANDLLVMGQLQAFMEEQTGVLCIKPRKGTFQA